jgi:hypothetical protein
MAFGHVKAAQQRENERLKESRKAKRLLNAILDGSRKLEGRERVEARQRVKHLLQEQREQMYGVQK